MSAAEATAQNPDSCNCGGVGCGGSLSRDPSHNFIVNRQVRRRWKKRVCNACRMRFCTAHYDSNGVNIPSPSCPARLKYKIARAMAAAV